MNKTRLTINHERQPNLIQRPVRPTNSAYSLGNESKNQPTQFNNSGPNRHENVQQSHPKLSKFEYFNNQPSKYYNVSFNYYPNNGEKQQQNNSPYETNGSSKSCTQLSIDVRLKPENIRIKAMLFNLCRFVNMVSTLLMFISISCYLHSHFSSRVYLP